MGSDTEALRRACDRFPIIEYLSTKPVVRKSQDEWLLDCPRCGKPKLTVNIDKRAWHCWVCQEVTYNQGQTKVLRGGGGIIRLVSWLEGIPVAQAKTKVLQEAAFDTLPVHAIAEDPPAGLQTFCPTEIQGISLPPYAVPLDQDLPYTAKRGITLEDARTFGLFWCPTGPYANRLIFPVWWRDHVLYWQGRAMWEKHEHTDPNFPYIKALNPKHAPYISSQLLFNAWRARQSTEVVITEGPIDAIHVGPDAVCTFGKVLHPAQLRWLLGDGSKVEKITIMYDGPSPTEPKGTISNAIAAARLCMPLVRDVRIALLPQGDPGDYSRNDLWTVRMQALPAERFLLQTAMI